MWIGPIKSLPSPRLNLTAQGMAKCNDVQSQVWYHSAIQAPLSKKTTDRKNCQLFARSSASRWQTKVPTLATLTMAEAFHLRHKLLLQWTVLQGLWSSKKVIKFVKSIKIWWGSKFNKLYRLLTGSQCLSTSEGGPKVYKLHKLYKLY